MGRLGYGVCIVDQAMDWVVMNLLLICSSTNLLSTSSNICTTVRYVKCFEASGAASLNFDALRPDLDEG